MGGQRVAPARSSSSAGAAVRCDCQKRDRGREYLALARIPERYSGCTLETFQTAVLGAEARERVRETIGTRAESLVFIFAMSDRKRLEQLREEIRAHGDVLFEQSSAVDEVADFLRSRKP